MRVEREWVASFGALVIAVGCATKAPEPQAPPSGKSGESVAPELDRLERELAAAEQRLASEIEDKLAFSTEVDADEGRTQGGSALQEEAPDDGAGQPRPTLPPKHAGSTPPPTPGQAPVRAQATRTTPCADACRALASMQRSADRICELTGSNAARCTAAKTRVERAAERTSRAGCVCRER